MAESVHGTGGQLYDHKKRAWPPEIGVFAALIVIILVFEALGALWSDRVCCSTPREDSTVRSGSSMSPD